MTNEEASVEDFNSKIARMRKDLAARGGSLSLSLAAPPLWRIAWRLGLKWTPPLFRSFWVNALALGSVWAVVWLIAWMYLPFLPMPDGTAAVGSALFGGSIFAVVTAGVADVHRKRLQLPPWRRY